MLDWVKWAWSAFSAGGYWPPADDSPRRGWFRRKPADAPVAEEPPAA